MSQSILEMMRAFDEPDKRSQYIRAPFGYLGSKYRHLDKILPHIPIRTSYIEPFGGSGAILLAKHRSKIEVFNDRHAGVTAFYRVIRDPILLEKMIERYTYILHSREEFYWCRDTWPDCTDLVERAARWYYIVSFSFNCKGVVFARTLKKVANTFVTRMEHHIRGFKILHQRLKNVIIENLDWSTILTDYDHKDAVFYLDPPYMEAYAGTYKFGMTEFEHKELLDLVFQLEGYVAISGYAHPLYDAYNWDSKIEWESAVGSRDSRLETSETVKEVLWIKGESK